jgi:hypothetical protein
MKPQLSLEQRVKNAFASQEVENVKALHTYYHGGARSTEEWGNIWSHSDDTSWAHAFGRMRGFDEVWFGNVTRYDMQAMANWIELYNIYPEIGGKDPRPLLEASVHTLVTDVIEVADDGMSARGSFVTPGVIHSVLNPTQEKYCMILWERYGSDFVFEDGRWVYLHEHVCPDIFSSLDCVNWAEKEYDLLTGVDVPPGIVGGSGASSPPVTDPGPMHTPYSLLKPPVDTVPWPEPYATLDDNNTYTKKNG